MSLTSNLLFEIGCEELPASFVEVALGALPDLAAKQFAGLRLAYGSIRALGTPRRLALIVTDLVACQSDLQEQVVGPPVKAAFKDGVPTKAAEAFAQKLGVRIEELRRIETPKGDYVAGTRRESGQPTRALLPKALGAIATAIPFRKSMRWGDGEFAFGRPIQWVVALLGDALVDLQIAGVCSGRTSMGHRFLSPGAIEIASADSYEHLLREAHVLVDPQERAERMRSELCRAAEQAGGTLIEDEFLIHENLSLVEEPHVIVGSYDEEFLELPERVILEVARGHQRYFGVRGAEGRLLPHYLAVVNTALHADNIRRGNDRVMRARLSDARFFYREDLKTPLADRRAKLSGIIFQKRLGTMLDKAQRIERLARELGLLLMLPEPVMMAAASGAHLCKCDLVSLMVGEFPELEGEMGHAYAVSQGVSPDVAAVISEHYQPRGATDRTPPTDAGALVAIADRLDTLVGCFATGLLPSGAADPYGLRRACLGMLRALLDRDLDLCLSDALRAAYDGYAAVALDLGKEDLVAKLSDFVAERLRGILSDPLPGDAVQASLAVAADRPLDVRARARAIAALDAEERAGVGEVFKRATHIAKGAPAGEPSAPAEGAHPTERNVYDSYRAMRERLVERTRAGDYGGALREVAAFAPLLSQYFIDVYVMADEAEIRDNRLRLMRAISETCSTLAKLELLGEPAPAR